MQGRLVKCHGWCAGGGPVRVRSVRAVVDAGVAVMGHVGLTPQSISVLGGFRPQGRSADDAMQIIHEAKVGGCLGLVALDHG